MESTYRVDPGRAENSDTHPQGTEVFCVAARAPPVLLDADFQRTLAHSYSAAPGGPEPVEVGLLALATLLQAYCHVGNRDAVELTVMAKR